MVKCLLFYMYVYITSQEFEVSSINRAKIPPPPKKPPYNY